MKYKVLSLIPAGALALYYLLPQSPVNNNPTPAETRNPASVDISLKSVDSILEGTRFKPVCADTLDAELEGSKGILFMYSNGNGIGYHDGHKIKRSVQMNLQP